MIPRLLRALGQPGRVVAYLGAFLRHPVLFSRAVRAVYSHGAAQKPLELYRLGRLVRAIKPRYLLEIGSFRGGTLKFWSSLVPRNATLISIDLPMVGVEDVVERPRFSHIPKGTQRVVEILGNSHCPQTRHRVLETLGEEQLDFLFIDGDHAYEGVRSDYRRYGTLVRSGGLIAFHDILPHPEHPDYGVEQLWRELRTHAASSEIVDEIHQRAGMGIGVIKVGEPG